MDTPLRVAAVGVGRIGRYHARHIQEIARETGRCELSAVVDRHSDTADRVARDLQAHQSTPIQAFSHVSELAESDAAQAAVIASRTEDHQEDAATLIQAGYRVLLEKPLTASPASSIAFARTLFADPSSADALMQAFQRRFDEPLLFAKQLLDDNAVGRPFKIVSVLEDPLPPPDGYQSPGILPDMSVHNVDEVIWLLGQRPDTVVAMGCNLYNHRISPVREDFDDALMHLSFGDDVTGLIQVSRNHVSGYRNETWVYGDQGLVHVGGFTEDQHRVCVEAIGTEGLIRRESFALRDYGVDAPVFIQRFGEAYKAEVADFVDRCISDRPFAVTHEDGLNAVLVAYAGSGALNSEGGRVSIEYPG